MDQIAATNEGQRVRSSCSESNMVDLLIYGVIESARSGALRLTETFNHMATHAIGEELIVFCSKPVWSSLVTRGHQVELVFYLRCAGQWMCLFPFFSGLFVFVTGVDELYNKCPFSP